jgi:apolipoprotein N-acyltransferase
MTKWIILAVVLGWVLFPAVAEAGEIRLAVTVDARTAGEELRVAVTTVNQGDMPARRVRVNVEALDRAFAAPARPVLNPSEAARVQAVLRPEIHQPGTYAVLVRVQYQDETGQPFSALAYDLFDHQAHGEALIVASAESVELDSGRPWRVELQSVDREYRSVRARLAAPDEIRVDPARRDVDLPPGQRKELAFHVTNLRARPGSLIPILAVVEYEADGLWRTDVFDIPVLVSQPQTFFRRWAGWFVLGALALIAGAVVLERRRRPRTPVS